MIVQYKSRLCRSNAERKKDRGMHGLYLNSVTLFHCKIQGDKRSHYKRQIQVGDSLMTSPSVQRKCQIGDIDSKLGLGAQSDISRQGVESVLLSHDTQ